MSDAASADIKYYLSNLKDDITLEETEDSWERITKAILSFIGTCEQGGYEAAPAEVINAFRNFSRPIVSAMNSERTRLCGAAIDLLVSAATGLGRDFEQLLTLFMPPLLALCGRTKKVVLNRARTCIITIIESTQLASILVYFLQNINDKSASLRLIVAEGTLACLNSCNPPDLERESRARDIESIIRNTARDANPDIRKLSRKIFECYKILLPGRVDSFTAPLTPTMKKYLDIKTTGISSQQSTSNLRSNLNMKPNVKPSTSTSASTSTVARNPGHTRTTSNSTVSQIRNLATSLTRVSRKEPITTAPTPYIPVRSVPTSKIASASGEKLTTTGPGSAQELKRPILPLRSHPSVVSRAATSVAPHRLPLTSGVNPTPAVSGPQSSASSGPRRVPMPPPPPPPLPAPAKEKPAVTLQRPTSRADTAPSGQRPTVSAAPPKKPVVTIASSLRDRGPTTTKISVRPNKPTTTANSSGSTKPLVITNKPVWGQSALVPKVAATVSQRTAVPPSKTLTKRPHTRQVSAPTSGASKTRPTTPALIALPPSPTPEDDTKIPATQEPRKGPDQNADQRFGDETDSARQSPIPSIDVAKVDDERQGVQGQEPESLISSETIANSTLVNSRIDIDSNSLATTATHGVKIDDEQEQEPEAVSPISSETLANPTLVNDHSDLENPKSLAMSSTDGVKVDDGQQEVQEQEPVASPISSETIANPAFVNGHSNFESHSDSSAKPSTDECLTTPQGVLPNPANTNAAIFAAKTPISALLSSIQRGFLYSPSSPLSPADSYLLPGPHGMTANKDRSDIPIQPFNFALHPPSNHTLGNSMAEMALGDIGVVKVADHKLFTSSVLMPDDGSRHAFVDINK